MDYGNVASELTDEWWNYLIVDQSDTTLEDLDQKYWAMLDHRIAQKMREIYNVAIEACAAIAKQHEQNAATALNDSEGTNFIAADVANECMEIRREILGLK